MKRTISLFTSSVLILILLGFSTSQFESKFYKSGVNSIITHADYTFCADYNWSVRVQKNGGGYDQTCSIIQPGSCKCVVNNAPQGYYTITINNGQCVAVKYNVYHEANLTNTVVYVNEVLDCY